MLYLSQERLLVYLVLLQHEQEHDNIWFLWMLIFTSYGFFFGLISDVYRGKKQVIFTSFSMIPNVIMLSRAIGLSTSGHKKSLTNSNVFESKNVHIVTENIKLRKFLRTAQYEIQILHHFHYQCLHFNQYTGALSTGCFIHKWYSMVWWGTVCSILQMF